MVAEETVLTIDEVNQRLPLVKAIVKDIVGLHSDLELRKQRLGSLRERHPASKNADSVYEQEVRQMEEELSADESRLQHFSEELLQIGGILRDARAGRVDFPGELSGERVSFCWQVGEEELQYWHAGDCGESSRVSLFHEMGSGESGLSQEAGHESLGE
ncbi:MAG: DUF2203 domain-containing protein [Planctomycetota bacterium]